MYHLKEAWTLMHGTPPTEDWDGRFVCTEMNRQSVLEANETEGMMSAYTFNIITSGWLRELYNGHELTLRPDDLHIYLPGMPVTILDASDDFLGYSVMVEEDYAYDNPATYNLAQMAYLPIVQLHEPKQTLPHDTATHLCGKMREIIDYLHSDHVYKGRILSMLYGVFMLDLQNAQDKALTTRRVPQRVEEIFIGFVRLLPQHCASHHDIAFYAWQLNISPVYLSRVVRQVSGRTVIDHINQFLASEACFLLRTSKLSIAQISDRLHFSEPAAFTRFFTRMKGCLPKEYRK